jgi:hypothetical protein
MTPLLTSNTPASSESPPIFMPPLLGSAVAEAVELALVLALALMLALELALALMLALALELALMLALELCARATGASTNTATKHNEVNNNNFFTDSPFPKSRRLRTRQFYATYMARSSTNHKMY